MSILSPQFEIVDRAEDSIRYLEHGWPTDLCRWHSHEELELHLVVETHGKAFIGDYIGDFKPGSLFLIGPHLPHNWVTDEAAHQGHIPLRDMLVQFNIESINRLKEAYPEFRELDDLLNRSIIGLEFENFDADIAAQNFAAIRDAKGIDRILKFMSFLLMVSRHPYQKSLSVSNVSHRDVKGNRSNLYTVIDYITENFAEEISLEIASTMANMSITAFSRNFQKMTGSRFTEFVTKVRIGQACSMLQATDEKISTICHETGFKNLANFNRQFLRIKNTTPSAYRSLTRSELQSAQASLNE